VLLKIYYQTNQVLKYEVKFKIMGIFIYFIIYATVIFLSSISRKVKNKTCRSLLVLLCIVILSMFGGLRDYSVGTDVTVYGLNTFSASLNFNNFVDYINTIDMEPLFLLLNYGVSRLTSNYHVCMFIFQLVTNTLIFKIAYDNQKECSFTLMICVFLFVWYNSTFNILRQSIAILIMLYSYKFIKQEKNVPFICCLIVAFLFHKSALICLTYPVIYKISKNKNQILSLLILTIIMLFLFNNVSNMIQLVNISAFDKYEYYVLTEKTNLNLLYFTVKCLIFIVISIFCIVLKKNEEETMKDLLFFELFDVLFYLLSNFVLYGYRVSYYFLPFLILLIPNIYSRIRIKQNRIFFISLIIILLNIQWLVRWYVIGYDGVIPYKIGMY